MTEPLATDWKRIMVKNIKQINGEVVVTDRPLTPSVAPSGQPVRLNRHIKPL